MELCRRIILLGALFAAILVALCASLSPLVIVRHVDFADDQKNEGSYMGVRLMTERVRRLTSLPLADYIAEMTQGRLHAVEGPEWEKLREKAIAADKDEPLEKEWRERLPWGQYPVGVLFFKPGETPVNSIVSLFRKTNDQVFLRIGTGEKASYLRAEQRTYSDDDFKIGGGLTSYPRPPTDFLFPGRKWSPWLALAGLALYILIPWPKRPPGTLAYRRWRVVLTDVVTVLLTVPFFSFPFFITGGTVQAFTVGWPLFFFFWPILLIGLSLVWVAAWFSSFALQILEDRLRFWTDRGQRDFLYTDMDYFQPVVFKPPRWLTAASWLAVLLAKGSARVGAAGRALILSSTEWGTLGVHLKNGKDLLVSITDQLGQDMIGAGGIVEALEKAGVRRIDEVREVRGVGLEVLRLP